jgi:Dolichyl-phosphate-mannose-protein mannosyltransferase
MYPQRSTQDQTMPPPPSPDEISSPSSKRGDLIALGVIAIGVALIHMLTNGRYGFHRDELQVLDDARHMDWGFVAYPPFTPFIERVAFALFGPSLIGLRTFSVFAQATALVLTGLMARELGAKRLAQIVAVLGTAVSLLPMFQGTEFQYSSFDYLWWVLIAYFLIRLLNSENPRWWLAIGAVAGLGLMTKYSMAFYLAAIAVALLLTPARRYLRSKWFWCAAGLALLIFLPNLIWQVRYDFVSLHFLRSIHSRDVAWGRANGFLRDQFFISTNIFAALLWLAGLFYYFAFPEGKRYRALGWAYVLLLAFFLVAKGRGYYLAPAYPMLYAGGSVLWQRWLASLRARWSRVVRVASFAMLALGGVAAGAVTLPIAPLGSPRNYALMINGDMREEVGWPELVATLAKVRDSLPPDERAHVAILTGNYGETGAVDLYGPQYGLPPAISGVNSAWYRGYGDPPPQIVIAVGIPQPALERAFESCSVVGHHINPYGIVNEEGMYHAEIFLCRQPWEPWPLLWKRAQAFG